MHAEQMLYDINGRMDKSKYGGKAHVATELTFAEEATEKCQQGYNRNEKVDNHAYRDIGIRNPSLS